MKRWILWLAAPLALSVGIAYAATTTSTMAVKDGNAASQSVRVDQNGDGTIATHNVPEVGGAAVNAGNPLPVLLQTDATQGGAGTGITPPTGGTGLLGYLSGIYNRLLNTLTVQDSAAETSLASIATNTSGVATASAQATIVGKLSGTLRTAPPALAYTASTSASVATSSGSLISAGAYSNFVEVCTLPASTSNVWLNPTGGTAAASAGLPVFAGGGCTTFGTPDQPLPTGAITAITDGTSAQTVTIVGG